MNEQELHFCREVSIRTGIRRFDAAVVLGSGLGSFGDEVASAERFCYSDHPCFAPARVAGHAGQLVAGVIEGMHVLVFCGRSHCYEGLTAYEAAVSARIAKGLGCSKILLTNAAGGVNPQYRPGDFMFLADHINFLGDNPLRGLGGEVFVDLCRLYSAWLYEPLCRFARSRDIALHQGTLVAMPGPSYETPAEVRALARLGADVVSMSTVPEAIMAGYLGMEVAGLSLVTNPAAGLSIGSLNHEEVLAEGTQASGRFTLLARELLRLWHDRSASTSGASSIPSL